MLAFKTPTTPKEAKAILDLCNDRFADITAANLEQLVRFLGANSSAWTSTNRERLHELLSRINYMPLFNTIIERISSFSRTDVVDECKTVLLMALEFRLNLAKIKAVEYVVLEN